MAVENEKQYSDMCVIKVSGTKKSFSTIERNGKKKGMLYITVSGEETTTFRFDVWDTSKIELLNNIPDGALVRCTGKCSNYNFETTDGEKHYTYDLSSC